MNNKKIVFMGTPEFSVPILEALIEEYEVIGVVTQPDKEVGRKKEIKFSQIKEVALNNAIAIFQPEHIKSDYKDILDLNPDIIITCAYGQIIPKEILDFPKYGCINVHASLLPKLRGGAPIHHAIIDGYQETGITIMYMDVKMDNGDIISQQSINITDQDNVGILHDKLSIMGRNLLMKTLPSIFNGTNNRTKQDESEVTFGFNITREEEHVDFNKSTREVFNRIRGLNPFPGSYAVLDGENIKLFDVVIGESTCGDNGEIIKVYSDGIGISTSDGEIIVRSLQLSGKKKMIVKDYLNGINKDKLIGKVFE